MKIILSARRYHYRPIVSIFLIMLTMVTLIAGMVGCASRPAVNAIEIWDWYDLAAIGNNMSANYILKGDLNLSTDGWGDLASPTANGGKGWKPIVGVNESQPLYFTCVFDGQGHKIKDLFINRTDEDRVGLFSWTNLWGVIRNVGLVNATVTGSNRTGGLVGEVSLSYVSNSYFTGTVTGYNYVGGLVGGIWEAGVVSNSYSTGSVTGNGSRVGGLVGYISEGNITGSYSTSSVTGGTSVGGLVGYIDEGTVTDSYCTGSVTGNGSWVGGLVGYDSGTVSDSYSTGSVTGNDVTGGLVGRNSGNVTGSYATGNVTGSSSVGGLVGWNIGTVSNSYSTGNVTGSSYVGGLVGETYGTVANSYSTGGVSGDFPAGGLVGRNFARVANSHYNYEEMLINGESIITIGALSDEDFEEWLANGRFLDINERLSQEGGYYAIDSVSDFKQLLAFGQDRSSKFRLTNDLNLATEPNFCVPYLAGEFDGGGHIISNVSFSSDFVPCVGLFAYLAYGGKVSNLGVENVNVTGHDNVGGLVGDNDGTVSNSYATGNVTGKKDVGGLVGLNWGNDVTSCYAAANVTGKENVGGLVGRNSNDVFNSYATGNVTGEKRVGGLVGSLDGIVHTSYATATVAGSENVGGLVGYNFTGIVSNSLWDTETSGQATSDGGTGKNTTEMKDFTTFSAATWNIATVANPGARNPSYIWNIVDHLTYPFLSWQSV